MLGALVFLSLGFEVMAVPQREELILEHLKPMGEVVYGETPTPASIPAVSSVAKSMTANSGEARYKSNCVVCHASGVAGAPKLGDKADWSKRLALGGEDLLLQHAIQGYKAMPAKGTCADCSDQEIKLAIEYMLSQSK